MCGRRNDIALIQSNIGVVFFINVEIFYKPLLNKILEGDRFFLEKLKQTHQATFCADLAKAYLTTMCADVTLGRPFSTIMAGLQIRPPSLAM